MIHLCPAIFVPVGTADTDVDVVVDEARMVDSPSMVDTKRVRRSAVGIADIAAVTVYVTIRVDQMRKIVPISARVRRFFQP